MTSAKCTKLLSNTLRQANAFSKTRMHSSRMHTVRCSGRWGRGGFHEGVCLGGVSRECVKGEVCVYQGEGGVRVQGGVCLRGVLPPPVDRILDTRL